MKRILYVRHGESTANINGVAGVSDAQLTEKGAEQAKITGQHLKNEGVVTIACSPFIRARQTAEIIAQELNYPVYEIVTIDELQERYLGEFEGTTGRPPEFFLNSDNEGGIESRQHMIDRATKAIAKLKEITEERGGTTLAIAHGQIGYYTTQVSKGRTRFEDFDSPAEMNNAEFVELWRVESNMTELLPEQPVSSEVLKEHPVIAVDIDGVLFDTPGHAVERWNSIHGTSYKVEDIFDHNAVHDKVLFRHWHDSGIETDKDTGEKYDDGFYGAQKDVANYLLIPGAREVLARLKHEYGASLHALTARKKANLGDVTLTALGEHFGVGEEEEYLIDELHFSGDPDHDHQVDENGKKIDLTDKGTYLREKLGAHIMVEDSVKNALSAQKAGVASFVLAQAYNQNGKHDWPPEKTAHDWDELYHLISKSLDEQGFRKISE